LPPQRERSCQQTTVGNLTNTEYPEEDWTSAFELGVEVVVQLAGNPSDHPVAVWSPAIVTAIAAETGVPELDVTTHFLPGLGLTTQLWIRIANLDGTVLPEPQEQQVVANLSAVMGGVESAQSFLSAAVADAKSTGKGAGRRLSAISTMASGRSSGITRRLSDVGATAHHWTPADYVARRPSDADPSHPPWRSGRKRNLPNAYRVRRYPGPSVGRMLSEVGAATAAPTPAPTGPGILTVELVPVPPIAVCFPSEAGAAASGGGPSFWMFVALLALGWGCYMRRKAGKAKKKEKQEKQAAAEGEGKEGKPKSKKAAKQAALDALAAGAAAAAGEGKSDEEKQKEAVEAMLKEGNADAIVDMFLNDAFTPGIDDSPDVMVNPVLAYIVNQERAKLKDEDAKRGEGDEGDIHQDDLKDLTRKSIGNRVESHKPREQAHGGDEEEDDNPNRFRRRNNFQPLKMLGWDFKKGPNLDETKQKVVKIVEAHLQKVRDIDVKKVPLRPDHLVTRDDKRYQTVRVITYNAVKAASTVSVDKTQPGELGEAKVKVRAAAAISGRKQLANKKLKTPVVEVEEDAARHKEGEGEDEEDEGEEGKEGAGEEAAEEAHTEDNHPPELKCSICRLLYLDPQELPCGHFFCHECLLDTWQVTAKMACPTCNTPTWKRHMKPKVELASKVENYKRDNNVTDQ